MAALDQFFTDRGETWKDLALRIRLAVPHRGNPENMINAEQLSIIDDYNLAPHNYRQISIIAVY